MEIGSLTFCQKAKTKKQDGVVGTNCVKRQFCDYGNVGQSMHGQAVMSHAALSVNSYKFYMKTYKD